MSRSVGLDVLKLRDQAPVMYSRAKSLHYSMLCGFPETGKLTGHLYELVADRPSDALLIARSFELADAVKYAQIIAVLHSMRARHASNSLIVEISQYNQNM